jgi:hypothetical protein
MQTLVEPSRTVPILANVDVVVAGAGMTGVPAAIAAARNGARTLLIERMGFLGGVAVGAWVMPWMTFHAGKGTAVVGGIGQEIVDRLEPMGGSAGHVADTIGVASTVTPFDPEVLKTLIVDMLDEAGVQVMTHTWMSAPILNGRQLSGVFVEAKGGRAALQGKVFIDATGDADLAVACHVPFESGRKEDGAHQPMTLMFRVANVDLNAVKAYMKANPEEFHHQTKFDDLDKAPILGVSGFFKLWRDANLPVPRDRLLFFSTLTPGEIVVNTTRIQGLDPTNPEHLYQAEREGRHQMHAIFKWMRERVPGFEHASLGGAAPIVGVRESRRIIGRYVLTGADVVAGRSFDDGIARGGFPVDIHIPKGEGIVQQDIASGEGYDIPYRCLLTDSVDNLLVAGKCFSADFEAHASARATPTCMAMGQAAGTAAAMSVKSGIAPDRIDPAELRRILRQAGAVLE